MTKIEFEQHREESVIKNGRKLMVVVATDFDSAKKKGVENLFLQYDEQGFFDKVILVSPYLRRDRCILLSDRHEFHEFGFGHSRLVGRLLAPLHVLRLIMRCRRLARKEGIQLIRATEPTLCGLVAWFTARLVDVPYCVSIHADYDKRFELAGRRGAPTLFGSRALVWPLEWLTLRGAARVMPIRDSLIPYVQARGVGRKKICVIPHGIDLTPFTQTQTVDIRKTFGIPADKAVISFAGRLSAENYVGEMLDAILLLAERRDDFVVVLAGGGPLKGAITARLNVDPVLAKVVRQVGFVSQETVRAMRSACATSLCLMGGFSLIEACAAGRPVIAYDVEWHHELVINGITGRLIPEHDIEAIANAIAEFLDNKEDATVMGAQGRVLAFEHHDIDVVSRIKQHCYREMLDA